MLLFLGLFIYLLKAHASFCFDGKFADRTDLSSCRVLSRENFGCSQSGDGAEYKYITMSCDGSQEYNLPLITDGKSVHGTEHLLNNTVASFNSTAILICLTEDKTETDGSCPGDVMNYTMLTCTITAQAGEHLPVFPDHNICSGSESNYKLISILPFIVMFLLFI
jgi:hypothetical protein